MPVILFILVLIGVLLLCATLLAFAYIDFILITILLYYKYYLVVCIGIPLIILIQSFRFRKTDIFADMCENFIYFDEVAQHIDDPEWRYHMFEANGPHWEKESRMSSCRLCPWTYSFVPHICTSQPKILYSEDKKCKVTIYHTSWQNDIVWQEHTFKVIWEKLDHD